MSEAPRPSGSKVKYEVVTIQEEVLEDGWEDDDVTNAQLTEGNLSENKVPSRRSERRRGAVARFGLPPYQNEAFDDLDEEIVSTGGSRATTPQPTETLECRPTPQKRKKSMPLSLTEEQEQDIADWYRSHEILYNRRLKEYKLGDDKMRLFEEKASQLDPPCTGKQLKVWIESMRTCLGKLTRRKAGQEGMFTHRQEWVLENFGYLTDYIIRTSTARRKPAWQVERSLPGPSVVLEDSDAEVWVEGEGDYRDEDYSNASRNNRKGHHKKASNGPALKNSRKAVEEGVVDKMSNNIQSQVQPHMDSVTQGKRHFAEMMFHETMQMDEHTWTDYQMQAFQLLMQFKQQRLQPRHRRVYSRTLSPT